MTEPMLSRREKAYLDHTLHTRYFEKYFTIKGSVDTRHGVAGVSCWFEDRGNTTRIWFIVDGVEYTRIYNRRFSERYIITLARRLADDASKFHMSGADRKEWK